MAQGVGMGGEKRVIGGRFELVMEIASRASCRVYTAKDSELGGITVAVKLFHEGSLPELQTLFESELKALRNVSHQTVVPIVAGGLSDDQFYIALEYISGPSLRDLLKEKNGPLGIERSISIISELCEALHEMHGGAFETVTGKRQLIHGHLDSRAVLFKEEQPRLAGFHPSAIDQLQKQVTSVARVAADAGYISPEQLSGTEVLDQRTDIYALGVLLYELICGERPFVASNPLQAAMLRMTTVPTAPSKKNPEVSPLLDAAILKALARNAAERFQSALEFRDALIGNNRASKNPFYNESAPEGAGNAARLTTDTLAVSFSAAELQAMLKAAAPGPEAISIAQPAPVSPAEDTQRTIMGIQTSALLRPGLILLSGDKRGDRVRIERAQFLIGSDPSCDICVSGKNASARQALIVEKNGVYSLIATSSKPVEVSGKSLKVDEEHVLGKGDIIKIGDSELRYLAPGEVYTLMDEGVAVLAAKGPGRSGRVLLLAVITVAVFVVGGLALWREDINHTKGTTQQKEALLNRKRDEAVRKLLQEGDELMKKGALFSPVGENALEKFQEVLTLESDNAYAKRRIDELSERKRQLALDEERRRQQQLKVTELMQQADLFYSQGQLVSPPGKNAKELSQDVLKLDPQNVKAKELITQIDSKLGALLSQVSGSLAKAKELAEKGWFTQPDNENAFVLLQEVRKIDPENKEARDLQYDMAAKSLLLGDKAKVQKQVKEVRRNYLTAQALGVDPACIELKMKGLDLIAKSSGAVVFSGQNAECPKSAAGFLESSELSKRIAAIALEMELKGM